MMPKTRAEAKALGSLFYDTGKPCKFGHASPKYTSVGKCLSCGRDAAMANYQHKSESRRTYRDLRGFIERATTVHGGEYTYPNAVYVNAHTPLAVECPLHGEFVVSPTNHVAGKKCPKCANISTGLRQLKTVEDFISEAQLLWGDKFDYSQAVYLGAKERITFTCREHPEEELWQQPSNHLSGQNPCPKCNHSSSQAEQDIANFLALYTTVEVRNRKVIAPKEIDIWLPELQIGIEYHGLYWHTVDKVGNSHRQKYDAAKKSGIRLVQIFEDEWLFKQELVKARLLAFIGKSPTFNARQLSIRQVMMSEIRSFLESTHIQGAGVSSQNYALFNGGEIVAVATFGKSRSGAMMGAREEGVWEVVRYASIGRVRGGFSKLLKAFIRDYEPSKIISYCDLRYGTGSLYAATGFTLSKVTDPDYWWVPKGKVERIPRYAVQKHKLSQASHPLHKFYAKDRTENTICRAAGWEKLMGVGSQKWVMEL